MAELGRKLGIGGWTTGAGVMVVVLSLCVIFSSLTVPAQVTGGNTGNGNPGTGNTSASQGNPNAAQATNTNPNPPPPTPPAPTPTAFYMTGRGDVLGRTGGAEPRV